jgi:hypothetical protein
MGSVCRARSERINPAVPPNDLKLSKALSITAKAPATIAGRKIAGPMTDGSDAALLGTVQGAAKKLARNAC